MRLGPVAADADVGDQGNGELDHRVAGAFHHVLDDLFRLLDLGVGHLEQQLVVDLEQLESLVRVIEQYGLR